jgi:hypothetical protein
MPSCVQEHARKTPLRKASGSQGQAETINASMAGEIVDASMVGLEDKYLIDVHSAPMQSNPVIDQVRELKTNMEERLLVFKPGYGTITCELPAENASRQSISRTIDIYMVDIVISR